MESPKAKRSQKTTTNITPEVESKVEQGEGVARAKKADTNIASTDLSTRAVSIGRKGSESIDPFSRLKNAAESNPELKPILKKVQFLKLQKNDKIDTILQEAEDISKIEAQVDQLIGEEIDKAFDSFRNIQNPNSFKLERAKKVAELLINDAGELNLFLMKPLRERLPKSVSDCHEQLFLEILGLLEDPKFAQILTSIGISKNQNSQAHNFIRAQFKLGVNQPLKPKDTRRAALSALLMDLRQTKTASCFTTAIAIKVHDTRPDLCLRDMKDLIEKGYMVRSFNGKIYQLTLSNIPVEELGFNANLHDADQRVYSSIASWGIQSKKETAGMVLEQIHYDDNRQFLGRNGTIVPKANSFDSLISQLLERPDIKKSKTLIPLLNTIKREKCTISIQSLVDRILELSNIKHDQISNLEYTHPDIWKLLEIVTGLREHTSPIRFKWNKELLRFQKVPICTFKGLIDVLPVDEKTPESVSTLLRKIKNGQEEVPSIKWLIDQIQSAAGTEQKAIKPLIDTLNEIKVTEKKSSTVQDTIKKLAMKQAGVTDNDLKNRKKINQPDILTRLAYFDKLMNQAKLTYVVEDHHLLLRGWEYGISETGRTWTIKSKITGNNISLEAASIYQSLWGTTSTHELTGLGLDKKLNSLVEELDITEAEKHFLKETFIKQFKLEFEKLFSERIKLKYQYGGFALYDTADIDNLTSSPYKIQKILSKLIVETGLKLEKQNEVHAKPIATIISDLSKHAESTNFMEHFARKFVNKSKIILKSNNDLPAKKDLTRIFKSKMDSGYQVPIIETYYQRPVTSTSFVPKDAKELLNFLIKEAKKIKIPNNPKMQIFINGRYHSCLFLPNHPSFRKAIDSPLNPEKWIEQHFTQSNEPIVFADSNWESNGFHVFFAFTKNQEGNIEFSFIDENFFNVNAVRELHLQMDKNAWVNNQTWTTNMLINPTTSNKK